MAFESTWRSPVLLIQGDDDRNVAFSQTVQLAEDLRKQGVDVEQLIFPDEVHDFLLHKNWLAAYTAFVRLFFAQARSQERRALEIGEKKHWTYDMKSITLCSTLLFRGAPK